MANIDYVVEWFFPRSDLTDHRVQEYYKNHWDPTGCQWLIQHSKAITRRIMEISLKDGPKVAIESLQIALNDTVIGRLVLLDEDGEIGPKTIVRLKTILESIPDVEESILYILRDF